MLRKMNVSPPRDGDGGSDEQSGRRVGSCRLSVAALTVVTGWPLLGTAPARSDPTPVVERGLPAAVIPTYREKGAPNFSYPTGGSDTGGGNAGGGGNGGGHGYNGDGGIGAGSIATDYNQYNGQSVGSGQCVALAQATSDVGLTSTWVPGEQVQGASDIATGTVIATFGEDGTYTNTPGQSHTAIYLGQNDQGIQVMDQWSGQPAHYRTIPWTTSNQYESGSQFYVVSH
jgi:hypothetical protein